MNREKYRAALNATELREDFRKETIEKLTRVTGGRTEKEIELMKTRRSLKHTIAATAAAAALIVSAAAAATLLSPNQVAGELSDSTLQSAFESVGATRIDQSVQSEGYTFTLAGTVSGAGLSDYAQEVDEARTYVVASIARTDGAAMGDPANNLNMVFTPLVSGYLPWQVNAWTLGGSAASFTKDGVAYYLFDCANLEVFADHTVYLAAYEGDAPSNKEFQMHEDGTISFTNDIKGPHALFTIPLDPEKADPAAAEQMLREIGLVE